VHTRCDSCSLWPDTFLWCYIYAHGADDRRPKTNVLGFIDSPFRYFKLTKMLQIMMISYNNLDFMWNLLVSSDRYKWCATTTYCEYFYKSLCNTNTPETRSDRTSVKSIVQTFDIFVELFVHLNKACKLWTVSLINWNNVLIKPNGWRL